MPKKARPKLKILPLNPTGQRKVPKPNVKPVVGSPFSQRGARARVDVSPSGVKNLS